MRVLFINLIWLLWGVGVPRLTHGVSRRRHISFRSRRLPPFMDGIHSDTLSRKRLSWQKRQDEFSAVDTVIRDEVCCPSVTEWISPRGGVSIDGELLEINSDSRYHQLFQQTRCVFEAEAPRCGEIAPIMGGSSRCVQKHAYRLAMVKLYRDGEPLKLDYFRINSSCAYEVSISGKR